MIGFRRFGNGAVVVGDPIGPPGDWKTAITDFEKTAHRTVWFGTSDRAATLAFQELGHPQIPIGFQTVITPEDWPQLKSKNRLIRYQISRSTRKNVIIREGTFTDFPQIRQCLNEWQSSKAPLKLYFMTDPDIALEHAHRRLWVAEQHGVLQGYLVASPIPQKKGWLLEQWVRKPSAPNGVIEQLVDHAITQLGITGAQYITMGLCPLTPSPLLPLSNSQRSLFMLGRWATSWFYNSHSLTQFKLKFGFPIHEPIYASFSQKRSIPMSCIDTVLAFVVRPSTMRTL